MRDDILFNHMAETVQVAQYIQEQLGLVRAVATMFIEVLQRGNKLMTVGNGGSGLEAQHFAAELIGHYRADRDPLAALALTPDAGILTAIANDYDYNTVFSRQVKGLGKKGDVLVAFSTSGNSVNVLNALTAAHEIEMSTVGFGGNGGGKMSGLCDYELFLPFKDTARVQEGHLMLIHLLCEHIDAAFADANHG